jgi:phage anti-repressor protein
MNTNIPQPAFNITVHMGDNFPVWLRELHTALESKRDFSNWAKAKLSQFAEYEDYTSFNKLVERGKGGSLRKEFSVTLDVAKHIAMMEQTPRGRQVRHYFIETEKAFRQQTLSPPTRSSLPPVPEMVATQIANFRVKTPADAETYERLCILHQRLTRPLVATRPLVDSVLRRRNH